MPHDVKHLRTEYTMELLTFSRPTTSPTTARKPMLGG